MIYVSAKQHCKNEKHWVDKRHLQSSVANGPMSPIVYCCICLESSLPETLASCTQSEKNNKSHKLFSATRTFREYFASGARVVNTSWLYNLTQHLKFIKALNQDNSAQLTWKRVFRTLRNADRATDSLMTDGKIVPKHWPSYTKSLLT